MLTGTTWGSSPLARGLPLPPLSARPGARIIPARAGFTNFRRFRVGRLADHPRSRGVYPAAVCPVCGGSGSSPLARGLRPRDGTKREGPRIIPARAGFTGAEPGGPAGRADHPRSRGVYGMIEADATDGVGSSPLARGLRAQDHDGGHGAGIIPARAGFTHPHHHGRYVRRDHPRSRGVYRAQRVRAYPARRGIIPARAGFTGLIVFRDSSRADHPRSRGVYGVLQTIEGNTSGSSPLARGLPTKPHWQPRTAWIIPARAGFTPRGRVRGGHD